MNVHRIKPPLCTVYSLRAKTLLKVGKTLRTSACHRVTRDTTLFFYHLQAVKGAPQRPTFPVGPKDVAGKRLKQLGIWPLKLFPANSKVLRELLQSSEGIVPFSSLLASFNHFRGQCFTTVPGSGPPRRTSNVTLLKWTRLAQVAGTVCPLE